MKQERKKWGLTNEVEALLTLSLTVLLQICETVKREHPSEHQFGHYCMDKTEQNGTEGLLLPKSEHRCHGGIGIGKSVSHQLTASGGPSIVGGWQSTTGPEDCP